MNLRRLPRYQNIRYHRRWSASCTAALKRSGLSVSSPPRIWNLRSTALTLLLVQRKGRQSPALRRNVWRTATLVMAVMLVAATAAMLRGRMLSAQPPRYDRVTFRKGAISAARFAPDEQTIIYGAAWDRPTIKLYRSRVDGTDVCGLDLSATQLLAVSRSGELAITSNPDTDRLVFQINGGAPRELLDNVIAADWSRDATQLAVARFENGKCAWSNRLVSRFTRRSTGSVICVFLRRGVQSPSWTIRSQEMTEVPWWS
jgi:hypothetical protein